MHAHLLDLTVMLRSWGHSPFLATFAICCRPSVCLSSVCNARAPYSGGCNFRQFFYGIWYLGHPLSCTENFMEIIPGDTSVGGVKPKKGSIKYSDFGPIQGYISETAQDTRYVTISHYSLIGNRIWAFDWYQNRWPWMTLNGAVAVIFVISLKSVAFGAHCVKVVEDIPKLSATEM